jgi:aryl-alcohol dehydrogenase-like predicted oxidoreductase
METRRLGNSDVEVTVVGLGCNQFGRKLDLDGTRAVLDAAIEAGITLLDTADIYGGSGRSEELMGEALRGKRDRVVLATKFGMDMGDGETRRGRAEYVRRAIDESLRRLQTDHVDFYWFHHPDPETPIAETLGALDEVVKSGKARAIGCSNFDAAQLEEADNAARENGLTPFVAVQNEYSLLQRGIERDVVPVCERLGLSVVPYFPLARGLLTGKYKRGQAAPADSRLADRDEIASPEQFEMIEALERFAQEHGLSLIDVAIGGLAAQPQVASVIAGATKPEQVHSNAAAGAWKPTADELAELDSITRSAEH